MEVSEKEVEINNLNSTIQKFKKHLEGSHSKSELIKTKKVKKSIKRDKTLLPFPNCPVDKTYEITGKKIEKLPQTLCKRCLEPLGRYGIKKIYPDCECAHHVDRVFSIGGGNRMSGLGKIICDYKEEGNKGLCKDLADLLEEYLKDNKELFEFADYIIPIPADSANIKKRGFDHIKLIIDHLVKKEGFPEKVMDGALIKIRETTSQKTLTKKRREENIKGAYDLKNDCVDKIEGSNILLFDDISTTGTTMKECAKVLKDNGAESVTGLTLSKFL